MDNLKQAIRTTLCVAAVCFSASGCDEQTATINEDSALRAASCALSPLTLTDLSKLAFILESQSVEHRSNGSCADGGIISRTDSGTDFTVVSDHCATTDDETNTAYTSNGTLSSTEISDSPVTLHWDFKSASLTQLRSGEAVGVRADGNVRFQQFESETSVSQGFKFDNLLWNEIGSSLATGEVYGPTELLVQQNSANNAATIEYQSQIELCGFDAFDLDVDTVQPLVQLESEFFPSSGLIEVSAGDGSSLSISLSGETLAIDLDSNGDEVNDLQLSMSWEELQGATTVASRQRPTALILPKPVLWPWKP